MLAPVAALGLALVGCVGAEDGGGAAPRAAIETFDSSPTAGFGPRARLNLAIVSDADATRAVALDLVGSDDPDVRIAAVYALSATVRPEDADALAPLLEAPDPVVRTLAAAGLLAIEDPRAVPILIRSLGEDAALPFGSPPGRVWQKARFALLQFTGQDLGLRDADTAEDAAATIPAWEAWWADARSTFEVVPVPDPFGQ
jgi:hypothetical protein